MTKEKYELNGLSLNGVRNIYEIPVIRALEKLIPSYPEFDGCSICVEDVYALVLSRLPATYAHLGSIVLNKEVNNEQIEDMVRFSLLQVIERPKHPA